MTGSGVYPQLELREVDRVAVVTFNNPSRANSLSNQTLGESLPRLLTALGGNADVRAVVITGAGRAFCAGSELDADGFSDTSPAQTICLLRRAHRSVDIIRAMHKPCIAAVNGAAIGAGLWVSRWHATSGSPRPRANSAPPTFAWGLRRTWAPASFSARSSAWPTRWNWS